MVTFINRIPAGTFLVPLLISALLYTIAPDLLKIGGMTEAFLAGGSIPFIIGMITFCSGMAIDVKKVAPLIKRHGVLLLTKLILCIGLSFLYMNVFGQVGIVGISALAFTVAICSMNPAVYIALVTQFGTEMDQAAFGLTTLFSIPALPMIAYALSGSGTIDWMPIISTIIPLILGMILGNVDKNFNDIFGTGMTVLIPILGWNLGQGMNLIEGFQSGLSGLLLVLIFYVLMLPLFLMDRKVLGNDGVVGIAMISVAGSSTAFPAILVRTIPALAPYQTSAVAQVLTLAVITIILTPVLTRLVHSKFAK